MEKVVCVDSDILGGTPVFWGTRVPVKNLFDYAKLTNIFFMDGDTVNNLLIFDFYYSLLIDSNGFSVAAFTA